MPTNPITESSAPAQSNSPPAQAGGGRLILLLALLAIAIGALAYDYLSAGPGIEADDKKLEAYVDELNRKGAADSKRITPDEIHKVLGGQPTWVDKHPDEHYEIEYFCKWGMVPVLNMRRHYIAVVYVGDEPRRYNSHHKNERPPLEALPITQSAPKDTGETVPPPDSADGGAAPAAAEGKAGEATPEGAPTEGSKKRKGKKKQEDPPSEQQEEKKSEPKQEEKAAESSEKAAPLP